MKKLLLLQLFFCSVAFADELRLQVIVEDKVNGVDFRDAIYYPDVATYESKLADGTHASERATRILNFKNAIENPAEPVEVSKEMLIAEKAEYQARIAELDTQIAAKGK